MIIEKGYAKLKVPHEGGELSFQYPSFKGTYGNVAEQIDKAGLKRPNSAETASLFMMLGKLQKKNIHQK